MPDNYLAWKNNMPATSSNPLSIPGGWNKQKEGEQQQQKSGTYIHLFKHVGNKGLNLTCKAGDVESVPRSAQGVVSESGEVLDDSGKAIGKITDTDKVGDLAGNTVNTAGDIVSETGDVLGKTLPLGDDTSDHDDNNSEYTHQNEKKSSGGLGDVAGTVTGAVGSTGKTVTDTVGGLAGGKSDQGEKLSQAGDDAQNEAPVNLEDHDQSTTDLSSKKGEDTQTETPLVDDKSEKQLDDEVNPDPQEQKESLEDQKEATTDDLKSNIPEDQQTEKDVPDVQKEAEDTQKGVTDEVEKDIPEDKIPEDKDVPEEAKDAAGDLKDQAEGQKDVPEDLKDTAEDKAEDLQDKEIPEGQQDLPDVEKDIPSSEAAKSEAPQSQAPQSEAPQSEAPRSEAPPSEAPPSETPRSEAPPSEAPPSEAPGDEAAELAEKQGDKPEGEVVEGKELEGEKPEGELAEGEKPEGELAEAEKPEGELAEGEEAVEDGEQEKPLDYSILKGSKVNKTGNLVDKNGDVVGRVIEGDIKQLLGKRCDENGDIWNDAGKAVGKGEPLPDSEREGSKDFAPFENFPNAIVEADGSVTSDGQHVGTVVEGDPKRLKGSKVDEDGDILDRRGNVVGKAEAWDEPEAEVEPEPEKIDRSALAGKRVNKAGNVVSKDGTIYGKLVEGHIGSCVGRMCDKEGNVRSESGDAIGRAELVPEGEREGAKDGPFAELKGCTVSKDGKVVTAAGDVVGRLISGDPKVLAGRGVDEDGDILDRNGNSIGKAERWEEPEVEKKKNPLAGRKVNREGNVVDENGDIVAKLTSGELSICSGKEVDEDGDVVNAKGMTIGHVNLLEDIPEPEAEPEPEEEGETEEEKQARLEKEKDVKLAGQLAHCIEQSLERIKPILRMITEKIESAERKPKEELDEEELVKQVRPLIEEGGKILTETNGVIRGLDPDGRIQSNAKQKSGTREASPEEHHLAEVLKEVSSFVPYPSFSNIVASKKHIY